MRRLGARSKNRHDRLTREPQPSHRYPATPQLGLCAIPAAKMQEPTGHRHSDRLCVSQRTLAVGRHDRHGAALQDRPVCRGFC